MPEPRRPQRQAKLEAQHRIAQLGKEKDLLEKEETAEPNAHNLFPSNFNQSTDPNKENGQGKLNAQAKHAAPKKAQPLAAPAPVNVNPPAKPLVPVQIRDYVNSLEAHLAEAHRQAGRLLRKEADLGAALAEFGAAAEALGKQDDVGPLRGAFGALYGRAGEVAALSKARSEAMAAEFQVRGGHGRGPRDGVSRRWVLGGLREAVVFDCGNSKGKGGCDADGSGTGDWRGGPCVASRGVRL